MCILSFFGKIIGFQHTMFNTSENSILICLLILLILRIKYWKDSKERGNGKTRALLNKLSGFGKIWNTTTQKTINIYLMKLNHSTPSPKTSRKKLFIIIDPLTIDIKYSKAENEADMRARNNQTVIRDRYWHIGQCELCIAYFVKIVFTAGVVDETREAIDTNKDIYWIFPKDPGPFEKYLVDPKKIYRDLDAFKKHVEDVMVPEIEKRKEKYLNKEK